jgi:hypothetical protein
MLLHVAKALSKVVAAYDEGAGATSGGVFWYLRRISLGMRAFLIPVVNLFDNNIEFFFC